MIPFHRKTKSPADHFPIISLKMRRFYLVVVVRPELLDDEIQTVLVRLCRENSHVERMRGSSKYYTPV